MADSAISDMKDLKLVKDDELYKSGLSHLAQYRAKHVLEELQHAIDKLQEAVDLLSEDHPERADCLDNLGQAYWSRFQAAGAKADLDKAIALFQQLYTSTTESDPRKIAYIKRLGMAFGEQYNFSGKDEDFNKAIKCFKKALSLTDKNDYGRAAHLSNLGVAYSQRYQRTGMLDDLLTSVRYDKEVLSLTPYDHLNLVDRLDNASTGYFQLYRRNGDLTLLATATRGFRGVLELGSSDDPDRSRWYTNLGMAVAEQYRRSGSMSELEESIKFCNQSVELTSENHPDQPRRLQNLGVNYLEWYRRTRRLDNLELSIQHLHKSVKLTPMGYVERPNRLQSLAAAYGDRCHRIGSLDDLNRFVQFSQESLDLTPAGHKAKADRHYNLGGAYHQRYKRLKRDADLGKCISQLEAAVDLASVQDQYRSRNLRGLCVVYHDRYERFDDANDLDLAIKTCEEALDLTDVKDPTRPTQLHSLGLEYKEHYILTRIMPSLERSIELFEEAVQSTPDNHLNRAVRLYSFGLSYKDRGTAIGRSRDRELAIKHFQEAIAHEYSAPIYRLRAGRELFRIHVADKNWSLAYDVAMVLISFVPLIASRTLRRSDMQYQVVQIAGLALDAAAVALRAGKPIYDALSILQEGRGVIAAALNQSPKDMDDISQKHPVLAEKFQSLQAMVNPYEDLLENKQRYGTSKRLEELIREIRELPGFEQFLLGPTEQELIESAARGIIVVVNISRYGCTAMIVNEHGLRAIELSDMLYQELQNRSTTKVKLETLDWLWEKIARPILDDLDFQQVSNGTPPRLHWVLTRSLARFPLHAAGNYSSGQCHDSVMNRVISSYGSSVKAIVRSRQRALKFEAWDNNNSMVLIGMTKTPDQSDLPFAQKEVDLLAAMSESLGLKAVTPIGTCEEVLSAMRNATIFHFAGHGYTDVSNPLNSSLILSDGQLTVGSISENNIERHNPFLAYLSACGTGQVKHDDLMDEGLHLIGAHQLIGFRYVIGTLWEVNDASCVHVARRIYAYMRDRHLSDDSVSAGLHWACKDLRDQWLKSTNTRHVPVNGAVLSKEFKAVSLQEELAIGKIPSPHSYDIDQVNGSSLYWTPYVHFGL